MLDMIYYNPTKVYFGKDAHNMTGFLTSRLSKKALLHYGGGSIKKSGLYDQIVSTLKDAKVDFVELGGVKPNPRASLVYEGIDICRKEKVDFILAVGGGSVIDSAKAIAAGACYNGDFSDFFYKGVMPPASLNIGVVLTVPGAGSESSRSCVISFEDTGLKRRFHSDHNFPLFAILNPELTYSVPLYQAKCGINDAVTHVFERYFTQLEGIVKKKILILIIIVLCSGCTMAEETKNMGGVIATVEGEMVYKTDYDTYRLGEIAYCMSQVLLIQQDGAEDIISNFDGTIFEEALNMSEKEAIENYISCIVGINEGKRLKLKSYESKDAVEGYIEEFDNTWNSLSEENKKLVLEKIGIEKELLSELISVYCKTLSRCSYLEAYYINSVYTGQKIIPEDEEDYNGALERMMKDQHEAYKGYIQELVKKANIKYY